MSLEHDLLRPDAYPEQRPSRVELVQTHISWVFLLERHVFKVKRPVALGFLDFASVARRKEACEAELRLNKRLAPDVYLGVVPVLKDASGKHRVGGGPGTIVDWAVAMNRLPDERRADHLLAKGQFGPEHLSLLATRIAGFHASAETGDKAASFASPSAVSAFIEENFAETEETIARYVDPEIAEEIRRWQRAFVRDHVRLFEQRIATGHVREGHGDLRLEHVYFRDSAPPAIIDCIEFSERFRYGDVCSDIAFLSMDLAASGRVDLAEQLLSRYARESNDFDLYALVDFYESYRAYVRGKISALLADDESVARPLRTRAEEQARRYFLLALSGNRRSLLGPSVVAIGGVIASGKSTIARAVGDQLNAPVVEADRTRKAMLGVGAEQPVHEAPWQGAYDPRVSEQVYQELLRRAKVVLDSERPVVIDASFRSAAFRKAARQLARARGAPFLFIECRVDPEIARRRLEERALAQSVSDGRLEIADAFSAQFEAVAEFSEREHIVIDTAKDLPTTLAALKERMAVWPEGLSG
jgi:uncharacterized protein